MRWNVEGKDTRGQDRVVQVDAADEASARAAAKVKGLDVTAAYPSTIQSAPVAPERPAPSAPPPRVASSVSTVDYERRAPPIAPSPKAPNLNALLDDVAYPDIVSGASTLCRVAEILKFVAFLNWGLGALALLLAPRPGGLAPAAIAFAALGLSGVWWYVLAILIALLANLSLAVRDIALNTKPRGSA